jgi:hypothetical protein
MLIKEKAEALVTVLLLKLIKKEVTQKRWRRSTSRRLGNR